MIQETIAQLITDALGKLELEGEVVLEHPADLAHGDFSCNIAMVAAKDSGKNPYELAEQISTEIQKKWTPRVHFLEKIEVAGPGFINFHLSEDFFTETILHVQKVPELWGKTTRTQERK